jgi:predicted RNA-binding protein with PUA-like domain
VVVDLKPIKKLKKSVSLAQIKADKRLANMDLIRLSRLSVQSVKDKEWEVVLELASES